VTEFHDANLRALDEIEDLLEAYADARLAPASPVLARMRTHVLARAASMAAAQAIDAAIAATDVKPARWKLPRLQLPRRAFAIGGAMVLTLTTGAAVLAAPPGSPFFYARLSLETAFLPSEADARLASHEQHIREWLAEAQAAATRGDGAALEAALAAYQAEVDSAVAELGDDADRLAHLEAVLNQHVVVLTALEAQLPAQTSIEHAIQSSQKAVANIKDKKSRAGRPTNIPNGPEEPPAGR